MAYKWLRKPNAGILVPLVLALLFAVACGAAATATPVPKAPAAPEAPKAPVAAPAATIAPVVTPPTATPVPVAAPTAPPKAKLNRLKIAVAPAGFDTNITWVTSRGALLDKRPILEYLIGIDRNTGAYIPELAEKWEMAPDGKAWTITLRKGVKFIDSQRDWGEFTAKDVRHAFFLITQTEAANADTGYWRNTIGKQPADVEKNVELVDNHKVVLRLASAAPELVENLSANGDLVIQSKNRWDAGGKSFYEQKVVGTGPFEFIERKLGEHILYKRVENHWRKTPEYKELEFRWVAEAATRLATLLAEEVHITVVERALQKDALAKGIKIVPSKLPSFYNNWSFGGLYFASPDKLDPNLPFVKKEVRQAVNLAINRKAIADNLLGGKVQPVRVNGYHPELDEKVWPGVWNPDWDRRFDELYGYNPTKAKALLEQAGYPNGFELTIYIYAVAGLPEGVDIGQAMDLDFRAVGLKPKLVEVDYSVVRGKFQKREVHGAIWGNLPGFRSLQHINVFHRVDGGLVHSYEHPFIEQKIAELNRVVDPVQRSRLLRDIGDHKFFEFADIPMFWLFADAALNPKFIAEYVFPGTIIGSYSHLEYVKLAQ